MGPYHGPMAEIYPKTKPVSYQYDLASLAEEGGEVAKVVGKCFRFGLHSHNPLAPEKGDNLHLLHCEVADFLAVAEFSAERGLLDQSKIDAYRIEKLATLRQVSPPVFHPTDAEPVRSEKIYLHKEPTRAETIGAVAIVALLIILPAAAFLIGRNAHQVGENLDYEVEAAAMAARCYEKSIDLNACADYAKLAGRPDLIPPPIVSPYKK